MECGPRYGVLQIKHDKFALKNLLVTMIPSPAQFRLDKRKRHIDTQIPKDERGIAFLGLRNTVRNGLVAV